MSLLIRRPSAPISESILDEVEEHFHLKLPAEYREFLLATNGGVPVNDQFRYRAKSGDKHAKFLHLYGIGNNGQVDRGALELLSANHERPLGLREGCLFIGEGETAMNFGKLVIACTGDDTGKVFYRPDVDDDKPTLYPVAESFTAFLDSLKHEGKKGPKPWQLAIYQGDLKAFQQALSGPKKVDISEAVGLAIEDGQWEIVRHLLMVAKKKDDLTPAWIFTESLSNHRYEVVNRVLTECDVPRQYLTDCLAATDAFLWLNLDVVRLLIDKGAEVNPDPDAGQSPLHCAVSSTNADAVAFLIEKGADPTVTNEDDRTPRELAKRLEETKIAQMLRDYEEEWAKRQPADAGPQTKPLDLCGITFTRVGKPITLEEIVAFEREKKLTLTPEYRWLLLQANGAILSANLIPDISMDEDEENEDFDDEDDEEDEDFDDEDEEENENDGDEQYIRVTFFPLRQRDCVDEFPDDESMPPSLHYSAEEASGWYHDASEIPKGMLPIAELHGYGYDGTGFLLIGCNKKSLGQLFAFDHGKQSLNMTLPDLFAKLAEIAKQPKPPVDRLADAITARDIAGVKAALADDKRMPWSTRDGRMPIRMMFEAKYEDAIRAYIDSGADLNSLMSDAVNFDRSDVIKEYLTRAKKVRKDDLEMFRTLPSVYRDPELLQLLQDKGVKFNKKGKYDVPLAHVAAESGSLAAIQFAIDQGADLHAVDKQSGRTALIAACNSDYGDPVAMVTKLLELGVKPVQWTCEGDTALHYAVSRGYVEAAKKLIDSGESMFCKYECYAEGMSVEQTRKMMQRNMKQMEKLFQQFGEGMEDEDDMPPPPDTSTPEGEKAAELIELMGKARENMGGMMDNLMGKMQQQREEGFVGNPANAQRNYHNPEAAAKAIPILEEYERSKRG